MNEELKPCPFCGGTVSISLHGTRISEYWWSINRGLNDQTNCTCRLFMESDKFDYFNAERKEEAKKRLIEGWNTRKHDG